MVCVAGLVLAACDAEPVAPATGPTGATGAESGATGVTTPEPTEVPPEVPSPVTPEHGSRYWAVYLAFGAFDSPEIDDGLARLADLGIEGGVSSLGCDQGADRIFGTADEDAALVGVYFETEADGIAFLATLDDPAYGPVRVRTYCLD